MSDFSASNWQLLCLYKTSNHWVKSILTKLLGYSWTMSLPDQEDACKTNSQMWSLFLVTFSAKFTKLNANSYLRMAGL